MEPSRSEMDAALPDDSSILETSKVGKVLLAELSENGSNATNK